MPLPTDPAVGACRDTVQQFVWDDRDRTLGQFATYDFEKQYKIYVCANQFGHPPHSGFAVAQFASQGDAVVPRLTQKLRETRHDRTIVDILALFSEMERTGSYHVAADAALMSLLRERVRSLRGGERQQMAEEWLSDIASDHGAHGADHSQ